MPAPPPPARNTMGGPSEALCAAALQAVAGGGDSERVGGGPLPVGGAFASEVNVQSVGVVLCIVLGAILGAAALPVEERVRRDDRVRGDALRPQLPEQHVGVEFAHIWDVHQVVARRRRRSCGGGGRRRTA